MRAALRAAAGLAILGLAVRWAARKASPPIAVLELREILRSRNDNDPRLDRDFTSLSEGDKRAFREEYRRLPPEARNERGTIVYLLGKNLASAEDWAFMKEVASEPPCLSLADCSKAMPGPAAPGDAVTLAYPSLVALKQAEKALPSTEALDVIAAGKASKAPAVARSANKIRP